MEPELSCGVGRTSRGGGCSSRCSVFVGKKMGKGEENEAEKYSTRTGDNRGGSESDDMIEKAMADKLQGSDPVPLALEALVLSPARVSALLREERGFEGT
jgi:hypothetical protein